jgi:hypothetical protein
MNYFEEYLKIENIALENLEYCESILKKIRSGELIYPEKKIDLFIMAAERSKKPMALYQKLMLATFMTGVENGVNKKENGSSQKNDLLNS